MITESKKQLIQATGFDYSNVSLTRHSELVKVIKASIKQEYIHIFLQWIPELKVRDKKVRFEL